MDRPALRRVLLTLFGTGPLPDLSALNEADWIELDRIAQDHRLQPLLHARHRGSRNIPAAVLARWQTAHRHAAMVALVQQADLAETSALLEQAGFAPIALKGAWLSVHAYPEAAQRPMRDIDLLVPADAVIPAYRMLIAAGYEAGDKVEMPLEDVVRLDKHMPPLRAPRGTWVELHHRLWERDGRLDHASPQADEAAMVARAVPGPEAIRYLAPQDLLGHLIVHAIYSHRLDCGPLVLTDIAMLLHATPIDWARFWGDATRQGWRDGARLLLELVRQYYPSTAIELADDPGVPTPAALLEAAPDLLLQELGTRASAGLAAAAIKDGPRKLKQRLTGLRSAAGEQPVARNMEHEGGFLGWAGSRAVRSLRDLSQADVRRQSRQLAALSKWLDR